MLFNKVTATEKRAQFRKRLKTGKILRVPGAFTPLVSMLIEEIGFDGVYVSGAVLSNDLGLPDVGLTTLSEVSSRARAIARVTTLPTIVDADTGFGEPMSAARTIQELEEAGLSGCHIEDQINPKRCGHLDGKALVDQAVMVQKIRAAAEAKRDPNFLLIARTDARGVESFEKAVDRAKAYIDAGAEMIFPEALKDLGEFEKFAKAVSVPILANMTEFGKSELFTAEQLENAGARLVIYPVTTLRLAMKAIEDGLREIHQKGSQQTVVSKMQTRQRLYELVQYEAYNQFDQKVFNFKI